MSDQPIDALSLSPLSESIQMYLVVIERLAVDDEPVPLSQLATELSVSAVSVNEMCRKLQDQGLVVYRPYKGVTLTADGLVRANYVLRRHRLWEVFLVEMLGLDYDQAHTTACYLEHTTPDMVADRLDEYLRFPEANPIGEPIPRSGEQPHAPQGIPLTQIGVGQTATMVHFDGPATSARFLAQQGLGPGAAITVLAASEISLLIRSGAQELTLLRELVEAIYVAP